jgi:hypothetical protein
VAAAAPEYVPLDNVQLIAVGDATKIAPVLTKYGPLEKYDAEGHNLE